MTHDDLYADKMESALEATLLSVPATPKETYQLRLTLTACENFPNFSEQNVWKMAHSDHELLHRVNTIHHALCTIKMGEFTDVIKRLLAAQKTGQRHVA